ncbi:hypothetical protein CTAYLR_001731 [Chrysophaeum taylorii]|uniref:GMP reductase n=1 Tax=Chrysophaeum taylorii TaxID=2483200 RepID=A0AAD7UH80_9STRA|nr:hypothetical protein CTAYLR_001731 [Chrysophaeum taylorii]
MFNARCARVVGLGGAASAWMIMSRRPAFSLRVEDDVKLDFKDVLIRPKRSTLRSRSEVSLERALVTRNSQREVRCVPIVVSNMDTVGTFEMACALAPSGALVAIHKHYNLDEWREFSRLHPDVRNVMVSAGTGAGDLAKLDSILAACPTVTTICLDVANGYSEFFVEVVSAVREKWPRHVIVAGNVVTNEMTEELILKGADIVKVGIGPGSVCTTRKQTGVGYPQVSAVVECADAAHGLGGHVIADGGITCPGDAAKAFGAGADLVMCGGMFSGTDESAGEERARPDGSRVKLFYGMSSSTAMKKHVGGVAEYRSSEGKTVEVPCKGPAADVVQDLLGGLRSACTYVGARSIKEMPKRTTFVRVSQQLNTFFGTHDLSKQHQAGGGGAAAGPAPAKGPAS